jgi:nucleoside phosphorylase
MGDVVRLGIVVGLPQEAAILKRVLGKATPPLACAGAQPARAAQGAAELIAARASMLLSFGFAGGLDPSLQPGDIIVGAGVVGTDGQVRATDDALSQLICAALDDAGCKWTAGLVAGADQALATPAAKQALSASAGAIIVDMDGTLTDIHPERMKAHPKNGGSWDEFQELADLDAPNARVIALITALEIVYTVIIITGRNFEYKQATMHQLDRLCVKYSYLILRPTWDERTDAEYKRWAYEALVAPMHYSIIGVFEDRDECVKMWRELGLVCYQVDYPKY